MTIVLKVAMVDVEFISLLLFVNWAMVQGVGRSKKSKTIDISGMKITIEALPDKARELNLLAGGK